jgi:transglutaminase-like putative cysteine protease
MARFHVACQIDYEVAFPSTIILNVLPQGGGLQRIIKERFDVEPHVPWEEFSTPGSENRFVRLETRRRKHLCVSYSGTVECDYQFLEADEIGGLPVAAFDRAAIPYLFPSRYCQSDRLERIAWDYFGKIDGQYEKVIAVTNWIHNNVEYLRGTTNWQTSAYDTVTQRTGVCRDFAHLGIALCRALNIPARYFSGYAYELEPPDFHACFEAYVGGRWLIFDATRLAHPNGLVRIGTGRDAADAAVASIFGRVKCTSMTVECDLAAGQRYWPLGHKQLKRRGVSLDGVVVK